MKELKISNVSPKRSIPRLTLKLIHIILTISGAEKNNKLKGIKITKTVL